MQTSISTASVTQPAMSQVQASKLLQSQNKDRLAAYTLAFDAESSANASSLYPVAPCFKEVTQHLLRNSEQDRQISTQF